DGNDDRRLPGANLVAQFRPRQVFEEYRRRGESVDARGRGQQRDCHAFRERGIHPRILGDAVAAGQLRLPLMLAWDDLPVIWTTRTKTSATAADTRAPAAAGCR